jgi:hypothetical protein
MVSGVLQNTLQNKIKDKINIKKIIYIFKILNA